MSVYPNRSLVEFTTDADKIKVRLKTRFGVELSAAGAKWPTALLDGYLARQGVKTEDRIEVKSLLRSINAIE